MLFDFNKRADELVAQKEKARKQEAQLRDKANETARAIVRGILSKYHGRLGSQFATVESNVATLRMQNGHSLTVKVAGEDQYQVQEHGGGRGFRDAALHERLQKGTLNKIGMMDTIIEWLDEN